jgi:hypothetical protein
MSFSRRLAILAGVLLPLLETARRWHQLGDIRLFWTWFDDYLIAGFLLYGAWRAGRDAVHGARALAAAWGFACALAFNSFFVQVSGLDRPDPSGVASTWVAAFKGGAAALAVAALVATLIARTGSGRTSLTSRRTSADRTASASSSTSAHDPGAIGT